MLLWQFFTGIAYGFHFGSEPPLVPPLHCSLISWFQHSERDLSPLLIPQWLVPLEKPGWCLSRENKVTKPGLARLWPACPFRGWGTSWGGDTASTWHFHMTALRLWVTDVTHSGLVLNTAAAVLVEAWTDSDFEGNCDEFEPEKRINHKNSNKT